MDKSGAMQELEAAMDARRLELGMKWVDVARAASISTETLFRFRRGHRSSESTHGVERALKWEHGSIGAILEGGEPTAADDEDIDRAARIAELESTAERLEAMARDLRRQLAELDSDPHGRTA